MQRLIKLRDSGYWPIDTGLSMYQPFTDDDRETFASRWKEVAELIGLLGDVLPTCNAARLFAAVFRVIVQKAEIPDVDELAALIRKIHPSLMGSLLLDACARHAVLWADTNYLESVCEYHAMAMLRSGNIEFFAEAVRTAYVGVCQTIFNAIERDLFSPYNQANIELNKNFLGQLTKNGPLKNRLASSKQGVLIMSGLGVVLQCCPPPLVNALVKGCAISGLFNMVTYALNCQVTPHILLIHACSRRGIEHIVEFLLKSGADPNTHSGMPLINCIINDCQGTAQLLISRGAIITPLVMKSIERHPAVRAWSAFSVLQ